MDGLPLALDQAGDYMEETQCSLASYLAQYRTPHSSLLHRRGGTGKHHPDPVATTWALSFAQVEKRSPPAADLLRCCAFLAPAAIPEQLIRDGSSELSARLQAIAAHASLFDEAIAVLAIRKQLWGRRDTDAAKTLNNLEAPYNSKGKYAQAEPLYQRALAIYEQRLGPEHPSTRTFRENYAGLLRQMEREGNR